MLVALSRSGEASESNPVPPHIIARLLEQFKSGTLPHYFVIKTLGDLASANRTYLTLHVSLSLQSRD